MNPFQTIGLRRVINASGRMTALGVSTISDETARVVQEAAQSYVVIDDLIDRAGELISGYTGGEDSCVTSCASAAIAMTVAGLITKGDPALTEALHHAPIPKNQIVLQKGHAVNYGAPIATMIRLGGGEPVEAGYSNETKPFHIEGAISADTAALLYVKSHHAVQKSMVPLEEMAAIAKAHNLPLIVDAAAEEDLRIYLEQGADLVIYSGAKAIEANTSGFVTGKGEYIAWIKQQYKGIGRAMKIGKEGIMGLLSALEQYTTRDEAEVRRGYRQTAQYLVDEIGRIPGYRAELVQDEAGRDIWRAQVQVVEEELGINAAAVMQRLINGDPQVYIRQYRVNLGYLSFDPRPLVGNDAPVIVGILKTIAEECKNGR